MVLGACRFEDDLINPAVPVDGFWACPLDAWRAIEAGEEVVAGRAPTDPSSELLSSSLPFFRRRRECAADLARR